MKNLDEYLEDCKRHLVEFASEEEKKGYYLYSYPYESIIEDKGYFDKCRLEGLSTYKALLYYYYYLKGEYII